MPMMVMGHADKEMDFAPMLQDTLTVGPNCCPQAGIVCMEGMLYHEHGADGGVADFFSMEHHEDDDLHCMVEASIVCDDTATCNQVFCDNNATMWSLMGGTRDAL